LDETAEREFTEFVNQRSHALLRAAYALCGDQHSAEDLLQTALAKAATKWSAIQGEAEHYVRRILYRDFVSAWRWRRRRPEHPTATPPERPGPGDLATDAAVRLQIRDALATLPARQRAVLVLRYLEDLSEHQVAEILGCSTGTVGSQAARALAKLRHLENPNRLIPKEVAS
jgi:RNA polymerase sigma-70 factor (sigma-E family)